MLKLYPVLGVVVAVASWTACKDDHDDVVLTCNALCRGEPLGSDAGLDAGQGARPHPVDAGGCSCGGGDGGGGAHDGGAGRDSGADASDSDAGGGSDGDPTGDAAPDVTGLDAVQVVGGLDNLVYAAQPKGTTDWYLVEQAGTVKVWHAGGGSTTSEFLTLPEAFPFRLRQRDGRSVRRRRRPSCLRRARLRAPGGHGLQLRVAGLRGRGPGHLAQQHAVVQRGERRAS